MDLHSGLPFWIVKNELNQHRLDLPINYDVDTLIIGSGITGALVAHELCAAGIQCAIVDKRAPATGSTAASTSQLQYEIDVPLHQLADIIGEEDAAKAYKASLKSITDIETLLHKARLRGDFQRVPSIYLASNTRGHALVKKEFAIRKKHGLPVEYLSKAELKSNYNIDKEGALYNNEAAQLDCYKTTNALLHYNIEKHGLKLFAYTEIEQHRKLESGYELTTTAGKKITCRHLVIAAGFEAGKFLPKQVMRLTSTYAMVSEPVEPSDFWAEKALIWETKEPYFYLRTTSDNRIMMGGEDISFKNERLRDAMLAQKTKRLLNSFHALFPGKPFKTDMAWCGTFSSTSDGLPYIGCYPGMERMYFALGYGGNGITFSMIAAQVIKNMIKDIPDERSKLFGFERGK